MLALLPLQEYRMMRQQQARVKTFDQVGQQAVDSLVHKSTHGHLCCLLVLAITFDTLLSVHILTEVVLAHDLVHRVLDRLVFAKKKLSEQLALNGDSQWIRDLLEESCQFVLLGHRALDSEEVGSNLKLQLIG